MVVVVVVAVVDVDVLGLVLVVVVVEFWSAVLDGGKESVSGWRFLGDVEGIRGKVGYDC